MTTHRTDTDPLADVTQFLGSEYLSVKDVEAGTLTFGITAVSKEQFEAKKGQKPQKPRLVLTLDGDPPRKLSLNATNLTVLIEAWGADARLWIGYMFDAYLDKTVRDPSGKQTGGLRVRPRTLATAKSNGSGATPDAVTDANQDPIPF